MDGDEMDGTSTRRKRKQVGVIPVERFAKIKEWQQYSAASNDFAKAKAASSTAKAAFKEVLRHRAPQLKDVDIDFIVSPAGDFRSAFTKLPKRRELAARKRRQLEFK